MVTVLEIAPGVLHYPERLDREGQEALRAAIEDVLAAAPLFVPRMPKIGKPFSVRMTNCGPLGWVSDERGYRYQATHPATGAPWPPMPQAVLALWASLAPGAPPPEACLVNLYDSNARMALHQDRDEADRGAPIVSLSLGDTALFRVGGVTRGGPTRSFRLASGDAVTLSGPARLAFHGVDRIYPGSSTLLPNGGRINLTLRRVTRA
jgi:alkylated DNA repair protein (DNA oxidative demethylase)